MSAFPPDDTQTWMVKLECLGGAVGNRFLQGDTETGKISLAPDDTLSATSWAVTLLAPDVVKFRCMGFAQAPGGKTPRFLDGRPKGPVGNKVGMRPMLGSPPSGEWWQFVEVSEGVVTLKCLSRQADEGFAFLDGGAEGASVTLARNAAAEFLGTTWRVTVLGILVALEYQSPEAEHRFLDGDTAGNAVHLQRMALGPFSGTHWLMSKIGGEVDHETVTLKSMGQLPGHRFLSAIGGAQVGLVPHGGSDVPGTLWQLDVKNDGNEDVELGFLTTFKCLGADPSFLDRVIDNNGNAAVILFSGTAMRWRVLPAFPYFEPCPRYIIDSAKPDTAVSVLKTRWVGQLTGGSTLNHQPPANDTVSVGVPGVDLGANAEDEERKLLFIFSGDVVANLRGDGPPIDADMVAFTDAISVRENPDVEGDGGIPLTIVTSGRYFDPFLVDGPVTGPFGARIGITSTWEVPSGAYFQNGKAFVFFNVRKEIPRGAMPPPPGCYIASKADPTQPGPFGLVAQFSPRHGADPFSGVAPVKVINAKHPWLPKGAADIAEEGLVMFGIGSCPQAGFNSYTAVHLAWMPLIGTAVELDFVRYFGGEQGWVPEANNAIAIFGRKAPNLQSISAAFLEEAQKWIVIHMQADDTKRMSAPVIAWIGTPPFDWSEPFSLFDPCREGAYGRYMHWPDLDAIQLGDPFRGPPSPPQTVEDLENLRKVAKAGQAYGAFLLKRYTRWDGETGTLDLYYLLSLGSPYQIQLMHTTLRLRQ